MKNISNCNNNIFINLFILFIILLLISKTLLAEKVFILDKDGLSTIPSSNLEFLEGYNETIPLSELRNNLWTASIQDPQSFINGYWVRYRINNQLNSTEIGMNHNWNKEKKIFISNSLGDKEFNYWKLGTHNWIGDGRIFSQHRIILPLNEVTTVYNFFRSKPFDRFMGTQNGLDRITVGLWKNIQLREFFRLVSNFAFLAISLSFAIYYFFIYIVSSGNYLWLSLSLFQASAIVFFGNSNAMLFNISPWISSSEFLLVKYSLLFIFLLQFFRKSLFLKENFPIFEKVFISAIYFYLLMILINFYSSLSWPSDPYLNLNKYPPDRAGPGIIKLHFLIIPFSFLSLLSSFLSFVSWRKGSQYAKYLCISFLLPLITIPIAILTFLIFDFTWITMLIVTTIGGLLFLAMFITFGFAVAQQLNDLKALAIQQQILVTEAYQRFVPPQLLKNLGKESILDVSLGDQVNVDMSILFSDIRSFTSISEKMTPKENFAFVNAYLNRIGPTIRKNKGYIDKFMGDGVMALFQNNPNNAVKAAINMQNEIFKYNKFAEKKNQHKIKIGIGINTGKMMLGTLGESNRMEGSVISDAVNLASRLEDLTKKYRCNIIISEETYKNLHKKIFKIRKIDTVTVKGKRKSTGIYEIIDGEETEIKQFKIKSNSKFKKAILCYQNQNFENALKLFEEILSLNSKDYVCKIYLNRCKNLLEKGWDKNNWSYIEELENK